MRRGRKRWHLVSGPQKAGDAVYFCSDGSPVNCNFYKRLQSARSRSAMIVFRRLGFFMHRKLCFASYLISLFSLLSLTLLIAADQPWVAKRIPEWSEQDAFLVLSNSPWVGKAAPALTRLMTSSQRREGGDMAAQGGGHGGIGLENAGSLVGTGGAI